MGNVQLWYLTCWPGLSGSNGIYFEVAGTLEASSSGLFGTNSHSSPGDISKLLDATRPSVFSSFSCNISFICGIFREVLVHHHAAKTAPTLAARVPQYMEGTYSCFMVHSLHLVKTKTIHLPAATSPQDNLLVLVLRKRGSKYIIVVLYEQGLREQRMRWSFLTTWYILQPDLGKKPIHCACHHWWHQVQRRHEIVRSHCLVTQ